MDKIFIEENTVYQIDLTQTVFATGSLHEKYQEFFIRCRFHC